MIIILHGDNEFGRSEAQSDAIAKSGVLPDLRQLNTEVLPVPATLDDLQRACRVLPFMGDVRIVIVQDFWNKITAETLPDALHILGDLPDSTCLIFNESQALPKRLGIEKALRDLGATVQAFTLPGLRDLPAWIQARAVHHGGRIDPRAAALLAQNIGPILRLLDQEIQKLLLYCGDRKTITGEDVQVMVPYVQSADVIFEMVDALGERNAGKAAVLLHRLMDSGHPPMSVLGMINRQFRLLIQVRWLIDNRRPAIEAETRLKLHPYVAEKIPMQARRFTAEQLQIAYGILAEQDLAIKSGRLPVEMALDLLVQQLTSL